MNLPLQEKNAYQNGLVTPDDGYAALSNVMVDVPTYITVTSENELPSSAEEGTIAIVEGV